MKKYFRIIAYYAYLCMGKLRKTEPYAYEETSDKISCSLDKTSICLTCRR